MIVIGSRGSQLALWQAHWIEARLIALGTECRIEIIRTTGDKITDVPLAKVGTKGLFTKELEEALLARTIDVAVHSLKDMPTELPAGLCLRAVPKRENVGKSPQSVSQPSIFSDDDQHHTHPFQYDAWVPFAHR